MNGYERIRAVLEGRWPDRRPVMLHNFMAAAREAGIKMAQFRRDPQALAQSFIQAVETYGYDGVVVDVDTATLAGAVGVPIDFPEDLPARSAAPLLNRIEEVRDLPPADILQYPGVQVWLEGTRRLVRYFGEEIFVRGNCDQAPFSLACCMRGIENWMLDIHDEDCREDVQRLLSYTTNVVGWFLTAMAATGAHMLSNGDSLAGPELISPGLFHELALPAEQEIARLAHQLRLPYALHVCGKANVFWPTSQRRARTLSNWTSAQTCGKYALSSQTALPSSETWTRARCCTLARRHWSSRRPENCSQPSQETLD